MQAFSQDSYKLQALKRSTIAISSVVVMEIVLGLAAGSLAIVSDGLHATLDAVTTLILFAATRASTKPPDEEHMYGHEKFESIGGLIGGIALIGIALLIMYQAVLRIAANAPINFEFEYAGFVAIGYTFCVDFFRVGTLGKALKTDSTTMKAGFYHAIADLSSTVMALLGFGLATIGFNRGDAIASVALSIMLTFLSIRVVRTSGMELSDAISKDIVQKTKKEILTTSGVLKCENLRVRRAGAKTFVEATVKVPDYLGLEEAHALTSKIESNVKAALGNADVTIHVEPVEIETRTEKLVEKLAAEIEGVKDTHDVSAVYSDGRLYITLHTRVDPKLSVHEAHEIAEKIENKINERIKTVENVTVHVEPFDPEARKGCAIEDGDIRKIVNHHVASYGQAFRIDRIVTYVADKKRYINIDCSFTEQVSLENAHRIASLIEGTVREHFAESEVTVHIEPK